MKYYKYAPINGLLFDIVVEEILLYSGTRSTVQVTVALSPDNEKRNPQLYGCVDFIMVQNYWPMTITVKPTSKGVRNLYNIR